MKKIFALLLGAVMSISVLTPALAACDGGEDAHEHSVANWTQTKAPTCTEEGEEKGACTVCGEETSRPVPALGHTIRNENIVELRAAATCTEDGLRIVHCPVCDQDVEDKLPALGHDWVNDGVYLTEPTCTEEGTVHAACSRCTAEEDRPVPALGHDWEDFYTIERDANFDHDGLKYRGCTRCDERTGETAIPMLKADEPTQYQLRTVRQNGEVLKIAGIGYEIFDSNGVSCGKGNFRNGTATLPLLPATYTVRLTSLPGGYSAAESYTISWEHLVADIPLTASLIMTPPSATASYTLGSVMNDASFTTITTRAQAAAQTLTISGLLSTHKIVVLNFWDVSCSFCRYEFPGLQRAYEQYKEDVAVIAVNDPDGMDYVETESEVRTYANGMDLGFYVTMDKSGFSERFGLPVAGYPLTVIIDCEGAICYFHNSALVNPQDYSDVEYSANAFANLFRKYTSAPYYHA